jgi:flavin-dependent dehydrogenase
MAKKYDVIVVGAGVSGFLAAKVAGENGLDVALVEKNTDPTQRTRACGESLVSMAEYWFGNIVGFNTRDKRIFFSSDGFSFKYDGPYQNLYAMRIYAPNGHKVEFGNLEEQRKKGDSGRVGMCFDKGIMFKGLLEDLKACNVDIFPGVNVQNVTSTTDSVTAEGSGQSFEGRYLIAADGTNSRVARVIGMDEDRTYYCNLRALAYHMSNVDFPEPNVVISTMVYTKDGAAQCFFFPQATEGIHNVLVISVNPKLNLEMSFNSLIKESFFAPWFKNAKVLKSFSANENCYSPITTPYKDRVLIAGDVGATQELENPGAMISGWKAGQAITTAVQEENLGLEVTAIAQYTKWWQETYIDYYDQELYMKAFSMPLVLTEAEDVNYVYGLINETLPACWHPYTPGIYMGQAMAKVMPTLQKERPDILQKLQKRGLPTTEIYADITKISQPVL